MHSVNDDGSKTAKKSSLKGDITEHCVDIQGMWWWKYHLFNNFFAVFDPSPLTTWTNCIFNIYY